MGYHVVVLHDGVHPVLMDHFVKELKVELIRRYQERKNQLGKHPFVNVVRTFDVDRSWWIDAFDQYDHFVIYPQDVTPSIASELELLIRNKKRVERYLIGRSGAFAKRFKQITGYIKVPGSPFYPLRYK
jgi:hypothetical protein